MKLNDFALMVSEVVTNAVKHGSPEADGNIGLRLERDQDALRVVVTDGGQVFAIDPGSLDPDRDESFGLLLVGKLADRWGYSLDGKKAIWLEVDTPRAFDARCGIAAPRSVLLAACPKRTPSGQERSREHRTEQGSTLNQPDVLPAKMYGGAVGEPESTTCPICGKGTLLTVDFGNQQPESRQVQTFTCGHEVEGGRLRTADADRLDVERRHSEETVTPIGLEE